MQKHGRVGKQRWLEDRMGLAYGRIFEEGGIPFLNTLSLLLGMALMFIFGLTHGLETALS